MAKKKDNEFIRDFSDQVDEFNSMIIEILVSIQGFTEKGNNLKKSYPVNIFFQFNANFIYVMALFERFIGHLNVYAIGNDNSVKKKYLEIFTNLCDDKIRTQKKGLDEWRKYFNKPTKMVSDYSILEKEKNGMVIMREILREKVNFSEKGLKKSLKIYNEARARRNLLAHRGRTPDKIYYSDLKRERIDDKTRKQAFKYLYKHSTKFMDIDNLGKRKKNNAEDPIDLSITPPYLLDICLSLIFVKESLMMDLKKDDLNLNIHEFLTSGVRTKNYTLLVVIYSLFMRKIALVGGGINLKLDEKVNFLLLREELFRKKIIVNNEKKKKNTYKIIESINEDNHSHDLLKFIKILVKNYVEKDRLEFFKNTKKLLNFDENIILNVKDWFIFKRYLRYKEFKDLFNSKEKKAISYLRKNKTD